MTIALPTRSVLSTLNALAGVIAGRRGDLSAAARLLD
jgi:hypothetical protein